MKLKDKPLNKCALLVAIFCIFSKYVLALVINVPEDQHTIQEGLNVATEGDTVLVAPGTYVENIFWPSVNGIKLLSDGDYSNTIIDGNNVSSVIYFSGNGDIDTNTVIQGFRITNGGNVPRGGGFYIVDSSPKLSKLLVTDNSTSNWGGGIYVKNGNPKIENSIISYNSYIGIYLESGNSILSSLEIIGNTGSSSGGGILILEGSPTISNLTISGNTAHWGGGINIGFANPTLTNVEIIANTATDHGGGISVSGDAIFDNILVRNNIAQSSGGGIEIRNGSQLVLKNSTITENQAVDLYGGGIGIELSNPKFENVVIARNHSKYGGGIHFLGSENDTLSNVVIASNKANFGGGLMVSGFPVIRNISIIDNTAETQGGGIFFNSGSSSDERANFINITLTNNKTNGEVSGIYVSDGKANVNLCNIAYNGYGLLNYDNSIFLDGTNNWWTDSSGPYHPFQNPSGQGDSVNTFVNVDPWLTAPNTDAPLIPVQNLTVTGTGEDFVSLSWDASPLGDLAGYKIYFDTDSSGFPYSGTFDVGLDTIYTLSNLNSETTYYISVTCYDNSGEESWYSKEIQVLFGEISTKNNDYIQPITFSLFQNYPNPFNPTTTISYQLPKSAMVNLVIYNVGGQLLETLVNERKDTGFHTIEWNAENVGSGLYFYRIQAGEYTETKKCLILK